MSSKVKKAKKAKKQQVLVEFIPKKIVLLDNVFQQEKTIKPEIVNPVLGYKHSRFKSGQFEDVEYNLGEILAAEDVESYLRQSNKKKLTLCFKEGWNIVGKNPTTVNYVNKRLQQISSATNISTQRLVYETVSDLIKMSNCFWVLVRDDEKSGGNIVQGREPVAGVFIIPAETVQIKTNNNGQITRFKQTLADGRTKEYKREDIIHFAIDRKNGFAVGTPLALPVLDDIRSLRRLEENIERLVHRDLFPLYQYKVGTETMPCRLYPDGSSEVNVVRAEIEEMPPEGLFVTPERHSIEAIGSEGRALRAEGYLKHFKQRVLSGLGLSSVDIGDGDTSNRSTADTMSRAMVDEVKNIQYMFEDMFCSFFIRLLFAESSLNVDYYDPDNEVFLRFNEIDFDSQIKVENHYAQMFSQHAITHDELRFKLGLKPWEEADWDNSFWKLIEEPKMLIQAQDEPYSAAAQALAAAPTSSITPEQLNKADAANAQSQRREARLKQSRGTRSGASQDRPSNQYGRKLEPVTVKNHLELRDYISHSGGSTSLTLGLMHKSIEKQVKQSIVDNFIRGWHRANADMGLQSDTSKQQGYINTLHTNTSKVLDRLFKELNAASGDIILSNELASIKDYLSYRTAVINKTETMRASNLGYITALLHSGQEYVLDVDLSNECLQCVRMTQEIVNKGSNSIDLSSVPPFHPNCECSIKVKR